MGTGPPATVAKAPPGLLKRFHPHRTTSQATMQLRSKALSTSSSSSSRQLGLSTLTFLVGMVGSVMMAMWLTRSMKSGLRRWSYQPLSQFEI